MYYLHFNFDSFPKYNYESDNYSETTALTRMQLHVNNFDTTNQCWEYRMVIDIHIKLQILVKQLKKKFLVSKSAC
jgi:hypothetical protein